MIINRNYDSNQDFSHFTGVGFNVLFINERMVVFLGNKSSHIKPYPCCCLFFVLSFVFGCCLVGVFSLFVFCFFVFLLLFFFYFFSSFFYWGGGDFRSLLLFVCLFCFVLFLGGGFLCVFLYL